MKHSPVHQRVAGLITSQGTYLGYYGFYPQSSCVLKATDQCHPTSFSFSPLPFSKIPISQNIRREGKRKKEREGGGKRKKEKRREGGREEYLVMGYGYLLSMYRSQVLESELTLPLLFFISCWCSYSIFFCHNSSNPVSQRCSTFKRNKESSNGSTLRYWCLIDMRICCVFLHN